MKPSLLHMVWLQKLALGLAFTLLKVAPVCCQVQIGFSAGYSIDVNNSGRFRHIPLSTQLLFGKPGRSSFMIKLDVGIPLKNQTFDSAFTLTRGLPPAVSVSKNLSSNLTTLAFGYRFKIPLKSSENSLFTDVLLGVSSQRFSVVYPNLDKENYNVLNPDVALNRTGLVFGVGAGYMRKNFVLQMHAQTPLLAGLGDYELSYKFNAPLQFSIGYFLTGKTKKN